MGKVLSPEEFAKKNSGILTKPYSPGGIGTGNVLPQDFGKSKYDLNATVSDIDNLNDFRAENQPLSERWKNGISKALINVPIRVADGLVTTTAAVVGGLAELGDAFVPGDNVQFSKFINNPISEVFDGISKDLQESMPVYRSDEYEEAGIGKLAYGGTFWADTMTDAASFMGASMLGGMGVSKALGGLTKASLRLSKAKTALNALEETGQLASLTNKSALMKSIAASAYGGAAESGVEARGVYNTVKEKLTAEGKLSEEEIERQAGAASNISFLTNIVLTGGANFLQFGKIFSKTADDTLDLSRLVSEGGKLKVSELSKTKKAYNFLFNNFEDFVTESGQEGAQFLSQKFLENYYTGDDDSRDDFLKSMINAVSELKSSEGIESMLAGAVLGGLSTVGKKAYNKATGNLSETEQEEKNLQDSVNDFNKSNNLENNVFSEETKVLASQFSRSLQADAAIKEANRNNDALGADLLKTTSFGDQVVSALRVGKYDDLVEQLQDIKNSDVEETNELYKSESFNKFTEEEKNLMADTALQQADKIKKYYEKNMVKYGKVLNHEDIAKAAVNDSLLDFAKQRSSEINEQLKPLIDIEGEIEARYKSPEEINSLKEQNDVFSKTIKSIKSDITAKGKDYKGERDAELEEAINSSNNILKLIEDSITDEELGGTITKKDREGNEIVRPFKIDYKSQVLKEANKRLNNLKAAAERKAGDITEWQKYDALLKDYVKIEKIKDEVIDARNKYAVDPEGYFAKVNQNIDNIRKNKNLKKLFTTNSQAYKGADGKIDKDTQVELPIEKGLYYTRMGRSVYRKESGQRVKENGKLVVTPLVQNKRKFIEVLDTFAKINSNTGQTEAFAKIKEGDTISEISISSLNGRLNRAEFINKEGILSQDKMTEEEAFYYNYKDRIIQYQFKKSFTEPSKLIEGQLAYNYRGDLVVRYFDEKGYPKYTSPLFSQANEIKGKAFQVTANKDTGKFKLDNSQYLKIYSVEESRKIKELIALKNSKSYFEYKLSKLVEEGTPINDSNISEEDASTLKSLEEETQKLQEKIQKAEQEIKELQELVKDYELKEKPVEQITPEEAPSVLINNGLTVTTEQANNPTVETVEAVIENNNEVVIDSVIADNLTPEEISVVQEETGLSETEAVELVKSEVKKSVKNNGNVSNYLSDKVKSIIKKIVKFLLGGSLALTVYFNTGETRNAISHKVSNYFISNTIPSDTTVSFKTSNFAVTSFDGCNAFVSNQIKHTIGKTNFENLGYYGDAWTATANMVRAQKGTFVYNIFKGVKPIITGINETETKVEIDKYIKSKIKESSRLTVTSFQEGDIVNLFYEGSNYTVEAFEKGKDVYTSHVGIIKKDLKGNLVLEHNIHGIIKHDSLSDLVQGKLKSVNGSMLVSAIARPDFNKLNINIGETENIAETNKNTEKNKEPQKNNEAGSPFLLAALLLKLKKKKKETNILDDTDFSDVNKRIDFLSKSIVQLKSNLEEVKKDKEVFNNTLKLKYPSGNLVESQKNLIKKKNEEITNLRIKEKSEKDSLNPNDKEGLNEIDKRYNLLITPLLEEVKKLEALIGITSTKTTTQSDIEAKKTDIEKRIQEVENFVNNDFFAQSELLAKHWKTKKDLFENKVKQLKDLLKKGIKTGNDLRTLTNLLNDIRGVLNEGLNINNKDNVELNEKNIQELANSLFSMISDNVIKDYINEMNTVMESRFGKDAVSKQLIQYTTGEWTLDGKNVEYFLSKETLENAKNNKQINAKYDAKLADLKQQPTKEIQVVSNKNTKLPHEDIMIQESAEIKKKLISLQEDYNKAEDKRKSAAKQLKKQIDFFNKKLVSIDEYSKTLEKEREKYEKYITNLTSLIEKTEKGEAIEFDELKKEYLNQIQQERGKYTNIVAELTATDEAFKQNKVLYFEVLKELREQFEDIINPDLLYSSEYFANVVNAMPDYGIDIRFKNRELTKQDFHEIVSFVIEGNGETVPTYNESTEEAFNIKLDIKELDNVGNEEYAKKIDKLDTIISAINTEAVKALAKIRSTNRKEFSEEDTINSYDFYNNIVNSIKKVEREITKDDSVFIPKKNLKIAGYNDVFIGADGNTVVVSPKKTVMQGLTTTSPNISDNFAGFPSNSLNENDKHQWVFQKWLNDNDATDYYIEYKIDDKVETYTRDKSFDNDPTQKAILVQIVKKDGTPLKLDSNGKENENGIYLPITVLEAGTGNYRPADKNGVKPAKYRETEEADLLKEQLKTTVNKEEREKIEADIEKLENTVKENLANIQKQREAILQVLENNERYVTPIVEQSLGIKIPSQDNRLSDVLGKDYKEKIRDGKLKVIIVKDTNTVIGDKTIQAAIGSVIIHEVKDKNPRIYFLKGKKINDYGFNDLVEKIQSFSANEITGTFTKDFKEFYNKIRAYVYWGSNYDINKEYNGKIIDETEGESEDKLKEKLYHLKFKYDTNSQVVEYGNYLYKDDKGKPVYDIKTVNVEDLQNDEQFKEFITSKYNHFSSSLLSDYMVERITDVKNNKSASILANKLDNNFTINLQKELNVQFQSQYLTPSGERITKFEKIKKEEKKQTPTQTPTQTSSTVDYSDVKFIQESLRLSDSLSYEEARRQLEIWTEEGYLNKVEGLNKTVLQIYDELVQIQLDSTSKGEMLGSSKFAKIVLGAEKTINENSEDVYNFKRDFKSVGGLNAFLQFQITLSPEVVGKPLPTNLQAPESTNIEEVLGTEGVIENTTEIPTIATTKTPVEVKNEIINENSIDNILGKVDEELAAPKDTYKPTGEQFYISIPTGTSDGFGTFVDIRSKIDSVSSFYKFELQNDGNTAKFSIIDNPNTRNAAYINPETYFDAATTYSSKSTSSTNNIKTITPGIAVKEGNKWRITQKAKIEFIDKSANKPTNNPSEEGSFLRKTQILESQPKIRLQDIGIKDFVNFFGVKFEVVKALTQSVGFGVMRETANDLNSVAYAIEVEENAPLGTEYHEKFHLFERAMFSPSQRKAIYSLYRQITETTVSDAEASELLAEEFRYYSIERVAKDNRLNGTALEKVLQFIKDFISGISQLFSYNKSDKMNKLFDLMYTNTLTDSAGRTIEQAIASSTTKTKLTSEEIRATQKSALLQYYKAFENTVPNFNHIDFLIDKEYNKKAKEIYARINIIDVEDSSNAESLIINHIITNMRIENPLLFSKFKDVNNRRQFIEEFKIYFETINKSPIDAEDLLNEELNKEENIGGKGELFEIDATSTNYIQGLPVFVKQLLSTISGDKNYLGLTEHVDISKLEIELVNLFEKATSSVEMNKLLKESGRPEFLALASRLMTVSDKALTNKLYREQRISKLNSFYTNLKKQIVSFSQVNVESEDVVTIIDKNRNTLLEKVLYDFKNNFKAKYSSTNVVELAKELQAIETSTNTDYEFITALGFTVDKDFITHLSDNGLLDTFKQNVSKIKQRDFKDKKSIEKFIKNPSEVSNVKNIADLISNYKTDSIPVQILVDNKPMYAIINRNYLFKKFNEIKNKFKNSTKGTYENQIARAKIIYNVAISTEEEIQKSSKMTEKPSFIFHIANAINKGISPYINTGDKSSYFGFQNLANIVPGEVIITVDDYVKVFKEIFKLEFETFTKFKSADEGTVMPNMKKFFSVSDDIIPAHTLEAKVFSNNELVYTDFESLYKEVEKDFIINVKKEADTANKNLLQALKDNNIVENDNKTFNFINKDSLNEKGITNAEQLVERLNLFFWESSMLQSKFLFGDLGVFGLDLAKRVPAGMATKIDGNYSPAIANLIDTELNYSNTNLKFNKVDDKGELVYDVLVMDDLMHEDKVLGELFDNYKKTTLSDGMGFEHIDSIRFREISEGTWGEEDIKLYQADLKGEANLEDLHKWTMKKTQYFGEQQVKFSENSDDTMGITTFNKMAVFPISRTIVKQSGSTTLAGIKKIMEGSNVPVVVFDSANKIARKAGFKLFDENNKINTSQEIVNPYKQTQYWKYYNTQQETHKKPKSEQTLGTQFSKVIFANLLEGEGNLTIVNKTTNNIISKEDIIYKNYLGFTNIIEPSKLKDNDVFVFGANRAGFHGQDVAALAYAGTTDNYRKWNPNLDTDVKNSKVGNYAIAGKVGLQEGSKGMGYGLVTVEKSGVPLNYVELGNNIRSLYNTALENPTKNFIVPYNSDNNLNKQSLNSLANAFGGAGKIPSNVLFGDKLLTEILRVKGIKNFENVDNIDNIDTEINNTTTVKAIDVINKIHEFTNERVDITKKLLLERLGVSKEKGGYKVASKERLLKEIKANLNQKDVSSVLKKEVEELLLNGRGLDITVGSGSFEAVLTALVDKMIIQPKKFGSPMAQAANIGFTQIDGVYQEDKKAEFNKNQIIKLDKENSNLEPLKFYQEGDGYMEVYLPNYFKTTVDLNTIDKRLLDLIGFRIPTQGPNSIEKIRVKGFLPESYGNMIIVPAQITTKSGSDFDIDKINLYFPNFTIDENGQPKYVESFVNDIQFKEYAAGNKINTFNKTKNDIKGILTQTKYKEVLENMTEEDVDNMSNKKIGELLKKLCSL